MVLAGGVMLGSAGTASAFAPASATPAALGGLRLVVGSLVLVAVLPLVGGSRRALPRLLRRRTVWVMAAASAAYQPLFFGAVRRVGVGVATLLAVGAVPVFAGVVGWAALAHKPTRAWLTATLLAVAGLALRCTDQVGLGDGPALGVVMALTAAFGSALYVVAAKAELDRGGHAAELPAAAYLLGSVLLAPLVLTQPLTWVATPSGLVVALYLGVVTMALGNVLAVAGMRAMPPGPASTLLLADPFTATMLGVLVLGESLSPDGLAGLLLVAAGLLLQTRALSDGSAGRHEISEAVTPCPGATADHTVRPELTHER